MYCIFGINCYYLCNSLLLSIRNVAARTLDNVRSEDDLRSGENFSIEDDIVKPLPHQHSREDEDGVLSQADTSGDKNKEVLFDLQSQPDVFHDLQGQHDLADLRGQRSMSDVANSLRLAEQLPLANIPTSGRVKVMYKPEKSFYVSLPPPPPVNSS